MGSKVSLVSMSSQFTSLIRSMSKQYVAKGLNSRTRPDEYKARVLKSKKRHKEYGATVHSLMSMSSKFSSLIDSMRSIGLQVSCPVHCLSNKESQLFSFSFLFQMVTDL